LIKLQVNALRIWVLVAGIAFMAILAHPVPAAEPATPNPPFEKIIAQMQSRYQSLKSMSCEFSAESKNSTTGMIDHMKGKLSILFPNQVRWDYSSPEQTIVFDGKQLFIYFQKDKQVFTGPGESVSGINIALTFFSDINAIREDFNGSANELEQEPKQPQQYFLELTPKKSSDAFEKITLIWDATNKWINRLKIIDIYGNDVTYYFRAFQENPGLKKNLFQFEIPKDTEVFGLDGTRINNP
jgi:outer membrane lipoprotein-sorting protein